MSKLLTDAQIKRRKRLQGRIAVTTSTLGLAALSTKGVGAGLSTAASRGTKALKVGEEVPERILRMRRGSALANKISTNTLVGSAGIGGVGGYNFASYTRAESRKRNAQQPVIVHKSKRRAVQLGGLAGAAGAGTASVVYDRRSKKVGRAADEVFRNLRRGKNYSSNLDTLDNLENTERTLGNRSVALGTLGAASLGVAGVATIAGRHKKQDVHKEFTVMEFGTAGVVGESKPESIAKAYDPETNRRRRLDHYSTAAATASGGAGAAAVHYALKAKQGGVLKLPANPVFGPGVRAAGAAAGLTGAAVAGVVASDRIRRYKKTRGARYTPLRQTGF